MATTPVPTPVPSSLTNNSGPYIAISVIALLSLAVVRLFFAAKPPRRVRHSKAAAPDLPMERPITLAELSKAIGEGDNALYIAVKDPFSAKTTVFDVNSGRDFYGPGGAYNVFAGKDATYCLATSSLDTTKLGTDLSTLTESQKDTHLQWHAKYMSKYPVIGYLVPDGQVATDTTSEVTDLTAATDADAKKDM